MININNVKKIMIGIISENNYIDPLYKEIAKTTGLTHDATKKKVKKDVTEFIEKLYEFKKRFSYENISYHNFLIKDEVAIETINYILRLYGKNGTYEKIINIINEI